MAKQVREININHIKPHPDNPRKDVGDVTELAKSIKVNGIMQNLTVVPAAEGYKALIGHRRLAAAKKAGLKAYRVSSWKACRTRSRSRSCWKKTCSVRT